jgi:nitrite reductase/ring-hydroxylating ferredoxin subunit
MGKLVKLAETKDLAPGQAAAFDVEGNRIAVFNVNGALYALDDTCPHEGGPLSEGQCDGSKVVCPWHDAAFDLKTGEVLSPPAFEGVKSYRVVVEGNDIKVEL